MRLWEYLKGNMERHENKIAFANSGVTYKDLINIVDKISNDTRLVLCEGKSREEQAILILKCIAEGNIAVPVTKEYGRKNYEYIRNIIEMDLPDETKKDLAFLMFTSGTSGNPKGVMLTNENIISNLQYIETYFDLSGLERICVARPLVHIAVLTGEILYALCCGLTIYFYEENFMPQRLLKYLEKNEIDVFCATPTIYQTLALRLNKNDIFLKVGVLSGEVLTIHTGNKILDAFPNTKFYNAYGLTEHSPRVSALLPKDFKKKLGSVGKAIGDVQIKIVDGELCVKSACVMKGYYLDEVKTMVKIQDGWLYTGDSAHLDSDGYLYIDGRKDGMIIKSGINVYPEEIENVVKENLEVIDCLVFGENTDSGIIIHLKYVGKIEINELRKRLIDKLNPNIIPSKIERVEELAQTVSGKKLRV